MELRAEQCRLYMLPCLFLSVSLYQAGIQARVVLLMLSVICLVVTKQNLVAAGSQVGGSKELPHSWLQRLGVLHHLHDSCVLWRLQPFAPHGRWQPQGNLVFCGFLIRLLSNAARSHRFAPDNKQPLPLLPLLVSFHSVVNTALLVGPG